MAVGTYVRQLGRIFRPPSSLASQETTAPIIERHVTPSLELGRPNRRMPLRCPTRSIGTAAATQVENQCAGRPHITDHPRLICSSPACTPRTASSPAVPLSSPSQTPHALAGRRHHVLLLPCAVWCSTWTGPWRCPSSTSQPCSVRCSAGRPPTWRCARRAGAPPTDTTPWSPDPDEQRRAHEASPGSTATAQPPPANARWGPPHRVHH